MVRAVWGCLPAEYMQLSLFDGSGNAASEYQAQGVLNTSSACGIGGTFGCTYCTWVRPKQTCLPT